MELKDLKGLGSVTLQHLQENGVYTIADLIMLEPKEYLNLELTNEIKENKALYYVENIKIAKVNKISNKVIQIIFLGKIKTQVYRFIVYSKEYLLYSLKGNIYIYGKYLKDKNYFLVDKIYNKKPQPIKVIYNLKGIIDTNLSKIIFRAFTHINPPSDKLPLELVNKYKLLPYKDYLLKKHFPKDEKDIIEVTRRHIYVNFFKRSFAYNLLSLNNLRQKKEKIFDFDLIDKFINNLPFTLTKDQKEVTNLILTELKSNKRINRLVEGDVGSGKTIVAIIAAYASMLAFYQVAFLVPTILLAEQHYNEAKKYLKDVYLLTSELKNKDKEKIINLIITNKPCLIIGTHSLLNDKINFANLGLVIIDEQQRFGVKQRSILQKKYPLADTIYFTATPIPRTLALTSYAGLDLSLIKTKPVNRGNVKTYIVDMLNLDNMFNVCQNKIQMAEQIYVVCPLIETDDNNLFSTNSAYELFKNKLKARYGIIHGKMKDRDKIAILNKFNNKEIDVLIATTIIEVGINVPSASCMVVLDADRYGLSELHQLRGRVSRSNLDADVFLVTYDTSNERLKILEKVNDGFILAEEDLRLRGPGELLSREQSGFVNIIKTDLDKKIYDIASIDGKKYALEYYQKQEKNYDLLDKIKSYEFENN